jgi:outer membrane receptor for ferrienterochelin and colicins
MNRCRLLLSLYFVFGFIVFVSQNTFAQGIDKTFSKGVISGKVTSDGKPVEFATIGLTKTKFGGTTDAKGIFQLNDIPFGTYELVVTYLGYEPFQQSIKINSDQSSHSLEIELTTRRMALDAVVVTGTKTFKRITESPIIVSVMSSEALENVQACNLSEGLKFQPGLRVETDCQTCNYTQLRMNGLLGGYSQILINGRPIFSPLTGLYGMEQLPTNMIDRIEVVRGGGSSLYGSSAIGGTVNVITKIPKENSYELNYNYQNINGQTDDHQMLGNATFVQEEGKSGISFFVNKRQRGFYDHNGDNFSEIPLIENTSLGTNLFIRPRSNQKLELSLSNLNEYRFGGEMVDQPAFLTQQSEERTQNVWMGSADYQINFNNEESSLITYLAWQQTDRDHYTGILPDDPEGLQKHLAAPPYGTSDVTTFNAGLQFNHRLPNFLKGENVLTFGSEFIYDDVMDDIPAYQYLIDQTTRDIGTFLQSDWTITPELTLLSGIRMDNHNLVKRPVFSPRASLLYKYQESTQFRLSYGTGFRAPQAFDTDLHIAFAGGGVSRVILASDLAPERSQSWSASVNYDKVEEHYIAGFTLEGFYTRLEQAFFLQPIGEDSFGEVFEKQNGSGATVQGITLELRANYDRKVQLETGFTLQTSQFDEAVQYIDELPGVTDFVRTPNDYGFATLSYNPDNRFSANLNYVYTGTMLVPHFAGAPNQDVDEIIDSRPFHEVGVKMGYTFPIQSLGTKLQIYLGARNLFNAYQGTFDVGKNRDSNFVYGPAQPRTFYVGAKWQSK